MFNGESVIVFKCKTDYNLFVEHFGNSRNSSLKYMFAVTRLNLHTTEIHIRY